MAAYSNGYALPTGMNSKGDVKLLQEYLSNAGYTIEGGATGDWNASTDAAYKQYLADAGVEGAATDNPDIAMVEGAPEAYNTVGLVKAYQRINGLEETGKWDAATATKYNQNMAATTMNDELRRYYEEALANYDLPSVNKEELRKEIETYLRPAYDQAIQNRKKATEENRALTDVDAYSRGMGSSTWVTDAKNRMSTSEASDVANMESDYAAALSQALLNQLNTNKAQELTAKNNAYNIALQLYQMAQNAKATAAASGGYSGGGGGGYGGGGYSSGGSSSGRSSSDGSSSSSSDWPNMDEKYDQYYSLEKAANPGDHAAAVHAASMALSQIQSNAEKKAAAAGDTAKQQYYATWEPGGSAKLTVQRPITATEKYNKALAGGYA